MRKYIRETTSRPDRHGAFGPRDDSATSARSAASARCLRRPRLRLGSARFPTCVCDRSGDPALVLLLGGAAALDGRSPPIPVTGEPPGSMAVSSPRADASPPEQSPAPDA